jgi:hypothetical protein
VFHQSFVHVIEIDAEALSLNYELFNLITEKLGLFDLGGGRTRSNNGSGARTDFKKARVNETADDFMSRVGVDFELAAKGANGREFVAGAELARNDRFRGRIGDLLVDW